MAQAQPDSNVQTLDVQPSENSLNDIRELSGKTIMGIGSDDFVVVKNLFDGTEGRPAIELIMRENKKPYRWNPGQVVNLPGYRGRLFLKHLVSMLHRKVDGEEDGDRNDYPLTDKWVEKALIQIQPMMGSESQEDPDAVVEMPDYMAGDENLSRAAGRGEQELPTVPLAALDATDESEAKYDDAAHNITPSTIDKEKQEAKTKGTASKTKETPLPQ